MKSQRSRITNPTSRSGFTMVECLIGLAISAMLLAAIAVAFSGSLTNYRENEQMFWSMNNARQALTRMTSEIRTAGYLDGITWYGVAHNAAPSNQCSLYLPNHEYIRYEYRSADKKLYLVKIATGQEYVLCDNVAAAIFTTMSGNGTDATSVQISLTVQEGGPLGRQCTLSAGAVVRRIPPGI